MAEQPLTPERIAAYIAGKLQGASDVEVDSLSRITGGASRETYRLRLRYRACLRAEVAETVASPEEIEDELRL